MTKTKTKYTDYKTAVEWGNCQIIMCNNLPDIDPSIYDNMRFDCCDEDGDLIDIYQWFITSLSDWEVDWNERNFPELLYTYSDQLECYILCVDHLGTSWDYVATEVSAELLESNPEIEYNKN